MKYKYSTLSIIAFISNIISIFLLFVGLFSAKWDYIVTHTFDTIFVLFFGTLIPLGFVLGLFFLIKSIISKEIAILLIPTVILGIASLIVTKFIGWEIFATDVLYLYKIKLGLS